MRKIYNRLTAGLFTLLAVAAHAQSEGGAKATHPADTAAVAIAYGQQPEWKRTSAMSGIGGGELMKTTSPNMANSLKGRIPGLTELQQSAEPGYDFYLQNMFSRGRTSYMGDQNMLVFIDGFEAPLDRLTATEIESITLLKDASALALYGMRGANGVLLVTTKRGMVSAPQIDIRVQTGIQTPTFLTSPVNASQYATLYNQARLNDGLSAIYTADDIAAYGNGSDPYFHPNVAWQDELLRSVSPFSLAEMSFRGGNRTARYYVMMNVTQNAGLYAGTDGKRKENSNAYFASFNFRSNIDVDITKNFLASMLFSGSVGDRSTPGGSSSASSIFGSAWQVPANAFPVYNPNGSWGGTSAFTNPVGDLLSRGLYREHSRTFQVIMNLRYDLSALTEGLSLSGAVAYNNYVADTSPRTRNYARYSITQTGTNPDGSPQVAYTQYGTDEPLTAEEGFRSDWGRTNLRFGFDYSRRFGERHGLDAMVQLVTDHYEISSSRDKENYINTGGRVTYDYNRRYIAEFSAAYQGTNNFPSGSRFGFFPAASVGWVLSEENFVRKSGWFDFLKLRASAGLVGNDQMGVGRYLFDQTYSSKGSYLFGTGSSATSGFGENVLANPDISWEKQRVVNVGLDASFAGHFHFEFDWFHQLRRDILAQPYATVPGFVGASYGDLLPYMNVGEVSNRGFEALLRYTGKAGRNVTWYAEGSAWFARNRIEEMNEEVKLYDYQYRRGHAIGTPFTLIADGLYSTDDFDAQGNLKAGLPVPQFGAVRPGDIRYKDMNGDGKVDSNDYYPVGNSTIPEWNYALRLGLQWKSFDVEALLNGVAGRDTYLSGQMVYSFKDNGTASPLALESWTASNPNASYPRLSTTTMDNNYRQSTYWRRNGSYLRMANLHVGYTLPEKVGKALRLQGIYVYANATNLFTLNGLDGLADPEPAALITYPLMRSYNIGLTVNF